MGLWLHTLHYNSTMCLYRITTVQLYTHTTNPYNNNNDRARQTERNTQSNYPPSRVMITVALPWRFGYKVWLEFFFPNFVFYFYFADEKKKRKKNYFWWWFVSDTRSTQTLPRNRPPKKGGCVCIELASHNRIRMQSNQNQTQSQKRKKEKKVFFNFIFNNVLLPPPWLKIWDNHRWINSDER